MVNSMLNNFSFDYIIINKNIGLIRISGILIGIFASPAIVRIFLT